MASERVETGSGQEPVRESGILMQFCFLVFFHVEHILHKMYSNTEVFIRSTWFSVKLIIIAHGVSITKYML